MKTKFLSLIALGCLSTTLSCSQEKDMEKSDSAPIQATAEIQEPHRYGGWYCPDNLNGFPPVDPKDWKSVPVVNGRMPTQEETQNGTSLIQVDMKKYPNAKPLDMVMPKLARYNNRHSGKEELVIVIQAVNISNDSIVGFRYLNGGNGSARLHEVRFLNENEVDPYKNYRFVTSSVTIKAKPEKVWNVMTEDKYSEDLQSTFDLNRELPEDWAKNSDINFMYLNGGQTTGEFAGEVFGLLYAQKDSELREEQFVEKFLLLENELGTELKIVCGPYGFDYEDQRFIISNWARMVKQFSEQFD